MLVQINVPAACAAALTAPPAMPEVQVLLPAIFVKDARERGALLDRELTLVERREGAPWRYIARLTPERLRALAVDARERSEGAASRSIRVSARRALQAINLKARD